MDSKILVTVGPTSLTRDIIQHMDRESVYLFRINLSHTRISELEETIHTLQSFTDTPICLDSEGAQIRNRKMRNGGAVLNINDVIKLSFDDSSGDQNNISLTPGSIFNDLAIGDELSIDFNSARVRISEKNAKYCMAQVLASGHVGSNKAVNLNRKIKLAAITKKDVEAIKIARKMGVQNFALSFAGSADDVNCMRELCGPDSNLIAKIESIEGIMNLGAILSATDEILIDRGDLSREIDIEKIPFMQRRIISTAKSRNTPVYVATNLLESMVKVQEPNRAEVNDVISTLLMGANGLVLAAETAIGKYPINSVRMIRKLIDEYSRWTPNTSFNELMSA